MALAPSITAAAANAAADAVTTLANGGKVKIYNAPKPADADTAVGTQTLLAELALANPAFGSATDGLATANAIGTDTSANADGTAAWFRVVKSDDATAVWDGTVDTSGADLNVNSVVFQSGAQVSISSLTYQQSKS